MDHACVIWDCVPVEQTGSVYSTQCWPVGFLRSPSGSPVQGISNSSGHFELIWRLCCKPSKRDFVAWNKGWMLSFKLSIPVLKNAEAVLGCQCKSGGEVLVGSSKGHHCGDICLNFRKGPWHELLCVLANSWSLPVSSLPCTNPPRPPNPSAPNTRLCFLETIIFFSSLTELCWDWVLLRAG